MSAQSVLDGTTVRLLGPRPVPPVCLVWQQLWRKGGEMGLKASLAELGRGLFGILCRTWNSVGA